MMFLFQLVFPILTLLYAPATFLKGIDFIVLRSIRAIQVLIMPELRGVVAALMLSLIVCRFPLPSLPALCLLGLHLCLPRAPSNTSRTTLDGVFEPFYGWKTPASVVAFADWVDGLRPGIETLMNEYADLFSRGSRPAPNVSASPLGRDSESNESKEQGPLEAVAASQHQHPQDLIPSDPAAETLQREDLERTLARLEEENTRLMRRRDEMRERLAGLRALAQAKAGAVLQRHADMAFLRTNFGLVHEALEDRRKARDGGEGRECMD